MITEFTRTSVPITAHCCPVFDRLTAPADRRTYATVTNTESLSEKPRDLTVRPRARSINDRPGGSMLGSGNDIEFIYTMVGTTVGLASP